MINAKLVLPCWQLKAYKALCTIHYTFQLVLYLHCLTLSYMQYILFYQLDHFYKE